MLPTSHGMKDKRSWDMSKTDGFVCLQVDGHLEAPILVRTSRSSQNAQGGRTRPFRMLARAVWKDGTPIEMILPDASEPFVVSARSPLPLSEISTNWTVAQHFEALTSK